MSGAAILGRSVRAAGLGGAVAAWVGAERGRFMPWGAVCLVAGALLYFSLDWEPPAWMAAVCCGASAVLVGLCWRMMVARGAATCLLLLATGFGVAQIAAWRPAARERLPTRATVLQATVRAVDVLAEGRRLVLDGVVLAGESAPLGRAVRVRLKRGDETVVHPGDLVRLRAVLRPPAPPAYPGGWDQQFESWFAGLAAGGTALDVVAIVARRQEGEVAGWLEAVRAHVAYRAMAALPGPSGAVAAALLTGGTRAIPQADREAFRDSGLAHLLAVAGLHIGAVMGLVLFTTRLALALWPHAALHWPIRQIAAWAALAAGACYLELTGGHVPILRAFAMASLVTLAITAGRRALSLRGLALAAGAITLAAPQNVVGVSFQMSFAAVMALIAGYEAARPVFARLSGGGWRRAAVHLSMLVLTSLLAGTASAPYGAYHFGHVQLYFIAANVVAVPLAAFMVLPCGVLALLLMPFGLDGFAFAPMGLGIDGLLLIARTVASWPSATLAVPAMPGWGLATFSLGLAWLCLWRSRVRLLGVPVMLAGLLSPIVSPAPDLLVSDDARLIALRFPDGYRVQRVPGSSRFVIDAWQDHLATGRFAPLGPPLCDPVACRVGGMLVLRGGNHQAACDGVELVVSAEPAGGVCPAAALIDRFSVWRDGAYAAWLRPAGVRVVSDRSWRGARPWVPPVPVPGQRRLTQPMAPIDAPAETESEP